jgi:hypothetical protein
MSKIALSGNASGTGTFTLASPATNTDRTLTLPDSTGTVATLGTTLTAGTAVTVSGTSVDFTDIPSWVKRVTVMFSGVSTNGTSLPLVRLGDAGGVEATGYVSRATRLTAAAAVTSLTATDGFLFTQLGSAAEAMTGVMVLQLLAGNEWVMSGQNQTASYLNTYAGSKTLSDTLTQVRITTVNGTDNFDAGTINILYEG